MSTISEKYSYADYPHYLITLHILEIFTNARIQLYYELYQVTAQWIVSPTNNQ